MTISAAARLFSFRTRETPAVVDAPQPRVVTTQMLPRVFAEFADEPTIHVLDLGGGCAQTIDFLSRYRCKVYFLDLFEHGRDPQTVAAHFVRSLEAYSGALFDVCLFWDLLNQLDESALGELSNALRPYVYQRTRGYAIAHLGGDRESHQSYRIRGMDQLEVVDQPGHRVQGWSQTRFKQRFDCFTITDDTIDDEGRLEVLFQAD